MSDAPRLTFDREFANRCIPFAREQLLAIPELEAIVVMPVWRVGGQDLATALVMGSQGAVRGAAEILHILQQLQRTYLDVVNMLSQHLAAFDTKAGALAEDIRGKQQRLAEIEAALSRHTLAQPGSAGDGEPTLRAPPRGD